MDNSVGNVFDYLSWRGDLSFEQSEFNSIDALILTLFSYYNLRGQEDFRGKTLKYMVNALKNLPIKERILIINMVQDEMSKFCESAIKTNRFKNLKIVDYIDVYDKKTTEQFAALTLQLPDNSLYIVFRGTDDSLVGWKEDCNMAFINGIPSQLSAAKYAQNVYDKFKKPFRMGGHSKGGNLSIWAGAHLNEYAQDSLLEIFNFDGPGFLDEFIESDEYKSVVDKVFSFIPESSIVGILMGHCDYLVIKSSSHLIMQHDPLSWNVIGKHFEFVAERSQSGKKMDQMINEFMKYMDKEQVSRTIEIIFDLMNETEANTLDDLKNRKLKLVKLLPKLVNETNAIKASLTKKK